METSRFGQKWSAPGSAFSEKAANSGANLGPPIPDYETQLANLSALNSELQTRRDIDALLDQFSESKLSTALELLKTLSSEILEPSHDQR